jgi:hypothetical protein
MNRVLWIVQAALALVFLSAGASKLLSPDAVLATLYLPPPPFMRVIGVLEIVGALGLVLPGLLRARSILTPLAATGLAVIMAGAVTTTLLSSPLPGALLPLVLGLVAAGIAYGRWRLHPLPGSSRSATLQPAGLELSSSSRT